MKFEHKQFRFTLTGYYAIATISKEWNLVSILTDQGNQFEISLKEFNNNVKLGGYKILDTSK